MLRPMNGVYGMGADVSTMAPPDDGGGAADPSAYVMGPPSSLAMQNIVMGPPAPAGYVKPSDQPKSSGGFFDWLTGGSKPAPSPWSGSDFNQFSASKGFGPPFVKVQNITSQIPGPPAPAGIQHNQGGSGGGSIFADILKGITGSAPAVINAYTAVKYPNAVRPQQQQVPQNFTTQRGGTDWKTYAMIGAGVLVVGVVVLALTKKK